MYTPPVQKSQKFSTVHVVGKLRPIQIGSGKAVRVSYQERGETKTTDVLLTDCFKEVQEILPQVIKAPLEWSICLSEDMKRILNFHPLNGPFGMRVKEFAKKEGELPVPHVSEGQYGSMIKFRFICEILDEELAGVTFLASLFYDKFVPMLDEEGDMVVGLKSLPGDSKHCDLVRDFCQASGVWAGGKILWKDNLLPELEALVLTQGRKFIGVLKNGWLDAVYEIHVANEEDDGSGWSEVTAPVKEEKPF